MLSEFNGVREQHSRPTSITSVAILARPFANSVKPAFACVTLPLVYSGQPAFAFVALPFALLLHVQAPTAKEQYSYLVPMSPSVAVSTSSSLLPEVS